MADGLAGFYLSGTNDTTILSCSVGSTVTQTGTTFSGLFGKIIEIGLSNYQTYIYDTDGNFVSNAGNLTCDAETVSMQDTTKNTYSQLAPKLLELCTDTIAPFASGSIVTIQNSAGTEYYIGKIEEVNLSLSKITVDQLAGVLSLNTATSNEYGGPYGNLALTGVTFDGNKMWFAANIYDSIIVIDTESYEITEINVSAYEISPTEGKFGDCVYDGAYVWFAPFTATALLRINVDTLAVDAFTHSYGNDAFYSIVYDGVDIWLIPYDANYFVRVNTTTGAFIEYSHSYADAAFRSAVYDDNGYVWCIPYKSVVAVIVKVDISDGSRTEYPVTFDDDGYNGAVFDGTFIWSAPFDEDNILKVDPVDGSIIQIPFSASNAFHGIDILGRYIWMAPFDYDYFLRMDRFSYDQVLYPNNYGIGAFRGVKSDEGFKLWFSPRNADTLVELVPGPVQQYEIAKYIYDNPIGTAFQGCCTAGNYIWFAPRDYPSFIRIHTITKEITYIPHSYGSYAFGSCAFDGTRVWFAPRTASDIVSIDNVTLDVDTYAHTYDTQAFGGAVFDGDYIWFAPYNDSNIVKIDPSDGSRTDIATAYTGTASFLGVAFDGSYIWLSPFSESVFVKVDVVTNAITTIPNTYGAFAGAAFEGTNVWFAPSTADNIVTINTTDDSIALLPNVFGTSAFNGAAFDGSFIWFSPDSADYILKIEPTSNTITALYDTSGVVTNKLLGVTVDNSGVIWMAPTNINSIVSIAEANQVVEFESIPAYDYASVTDTKFRDCVEDDLGYIWFAANNAPDIVKINKTTGEITTYTHGYGTGSQAFEACAFDGTYVWFAPDQASDILRINASTGAFTTYAHSYALNAFSGCVFDGTYIWMLPFDETNFVRITPGTGARTEFASPVGARGIYNGVLVGGDIWCCPYSDNKIVKINILAGISTTYTVSELTTADSEFIGIAYDGTSIWMIPFNADFILKVDPSDGSYETIPFDYGAAAHVGAVYAGGYIWAIAYDSDVTVRINPLDNSIVEYPNIYGKSFFRAISANGTLWAAPAEANYFASASYEDYVPPVSTTLKSFPPDEGYTDLKMKIDDSETIYNITCGAVVEPTNDVGEPGDYRAPIERFIDVEISTGRENL